MSYTGPVVLLLGYVGIGRILAWTKQVKSLMSNLTVNTVLIDLQQVIVTLE